MKVFFYVYCPILLLCFSFTSCISISKSQISKTPEFDPDKSVRIVALNSSDIVLGRMEHYLLSEGMNVMPDAFLRGPVQMGSINVSSSDTTFQIPQSQYFNLKQFEEKDVDYLIRYQYQMATSLNKTAFLYLNIQVIDTESGKNVAHYRFTQGNLGFGKKKMDKVLENFAKELSSR